MEVSPQAKQGDFTFDNRSFLFAPPAFDKERLHDINNVFDCGFVEQIKTILDKIATQNDVVIVELKIKIINIQKKYFDKIFARMGRMTNARKRTLPKNQVR